MSKFCTKCGNMLDETSRFCGACGAPVAVPAPAPVQETPPVQEPAAVPEPTPVQEPVYAPQPAPVQEPVYTPQPAPQAAPSYHYQVQQAVYTPPKKKSKAGLIVVIVAIIAALAVAAIFVPWDDLFGGSSGSGKSGSGSSGAGASSMEDAVQAFLDVNFRFDLDQLEVLAPSAYWDYIEDETGMTFKDLKQELEDSFENQLESAEEIFGRNYEVSFVITDEEEMDEDDLAYVAEAMENTYGIDADSLEAVVCLDIDMSVEGNGESYEDSISEAHLAKIDGKWYPVDIDLDDEDTEIEFAADNFVDEAY